MMNDYGCGKGGLDNSGFHYDDCAGGPCGCDERRYGSWSGRRDGGSCTGAVVGIMLIFISIIIAILRWWICDKKDIAREFIHKLKMKM